MFVNDNSFSALKPGFQTDRFAAKWEGTFPVETAGDYYISTRSDDGSRVYIDDVLVTDNWGIHPATTKTGKISLNKGWHNVVVDFFENNGGAKMELVWRGPDTPSQSDFPMSAWN